MWKCEIFASSDLEDVNCEKRRKKNYGRKKTHPFFHQTKYIILLRHEVNENATMSTTKKKTTPVYNFRSAHSFYFSLCLSFTMQAGLENMNFLSLWKETFKEHYNTKSPLKLFVVLLWKCVSNFGGFIFIICIYIFFWITYNQLVDIWSKKREFFFGEIWP